MMVEDRLSRLPNELIYKILSRFDMKFVVQTCLLSSRWKLLWTSMPFLNFSSDYFGTPRKFAEFVTHVLSPRNHQIEVSSVKLYFRRAVNQVFVRKIANYVFSHNVQELTVFSWLESPLPYYPHCLISSQSLKRFTFTSYNPPCSIILKTPLDFPALTTLHLFGMVLCCGDIFSKCVNLKNLTLDHFLIKAVEVFDIITPQLSNLTLIEGSCWTVVVSVIAPQLENLTVVGCSIKYLNAPPGVSSLCHRGSRPWQLSTDQCHFLNTVTIGLDLYCLPYTEEYACKTINMLQELHSVRYLTLDTNIVEFISSFSDLLLHRPSPFSNLICLTIIESSMRRFSKDANKFEMSTEARNFLLQNSPSATLIMKLPKGC